MSLTGASLYFKSLETWLFVEIIVQANDKGMIKDLHNWPFVRDILQSPVNSLVSQLFFPLAVSTRTTYTSL